jgi:hypothetical protein
MAALNRGAGFGAKIVDMIRGLCPRFIFPFTQWGLAAIARPNLTQINLLEFSDLDVGSA